MNRKLFSLSPVLAPVFWAFLSVAPLGAASVSFPYTDNFQTTTVGQDPADWTEANGGTWVIGNDGGDNFYQATRGPLGSATSSLQVTGVTGNDFLITSSFQINDEPGTATDEYVGIGAFGTAASFGSGFYLADVRGIGPMRIVSIFGGVTTGFTAGSGNFGESLVQGTTYTMMLQGTYDSGTLNLAFTVTDGITTQTITASDTTPRTGEYFGLRINNSNSTETMGAQFNDYTISAVPEPATWALMASMLGLCCAVVRRRIAK